MRKIPKIRLLFEDYIAVLFVTATGLVYLTAFLTSQSVEHAQSVIFYYFLLPFIVILIRESFCYLFSKSSELTPLISFFRDWFPFLIILSMYYSFYDGLNHFIVRDDQDKLLASWDFFLFRCQPSAEFQNLASIPYLTDWLSFCYLSFLVLPPLTAGYFYLKGFKKSFRLAMIGLVLIETAGCAGYLLLPAVGPMYAFREWYHVPLYGSVLTDWVTDIINFTRLPRDCFPSLHTAISALFYFFSFSESRALFFLTTPVVISLWASCIILRYHYAVDVLSGLLLAVIVFFLLKKKSRFFLGELHD